MSHVKILIYCEFLFASSQVYYTILGSKIVQISTYSTMYTHTTFPDDVIKPRQQVLRGFYFCRVSSFSCLHAWSPLVGSAADVAKLGS